MFKFSQQSLKNMAGIDDRLMEVAKAAIKISKIDFGVPATGGLRTAVQQRKLYDAGRSKADGRINISKHQFGKALDVFAYSNNNANYDEHNLALVAAAFLQSASMLGYRLKWGGLWTGFVDMPHFELLD